MAFAVSAKCFLREVVGRVEIYLVEMIYMLNIGPFITAFLISLIGIPPIIWFANKNGIVDKPNGRKVHKKPVPLLGGMAIFVAFTVSLLIFIGFNIKTISIVFCSIILVSLGLVDDIYDIEAKKKLIVQICCAVITVVSGIKVNVGEYITENIYMAFMIDSFISICWIIGIINAVNLIDGLDGLAGGVSIIASVAFMIVLKKKGLDGMGYIIALSLAGSILGFLFYNFYPAKIFMGDMGSTFIGFLLAVLGIASLDVPSNPASIFAPIIILAVPIFDTGLAIVRRMMRKQPIFNADKNHLHHCILEKGFTQKQTVAIIYVFALLVALIGVVVTKGGHFYLGLTVVVFFIILGILVNLIGPFKIKDVFGKTYHEISFTKDENIHFDS